MSPIETLRRTIHLLPEHVANRIAAGEVAERPASVLKELIENSLDAGAGRIEIAVEAGGKGAIVVRDDGCGMARDDALLALRRHATSKIVRAEDLDAIQTLGFRGEALPSVASVSKLEIVTRPAESGTGTRITVEGGKIGDVGEAGAAVGTQVRVRDLFFNVPARRRFLRSAQAELRQCTDVVMRAALVNPEVAFTYLVDGRRRAHYDASEEFEARVTAVVGKALAAGMRSVHHSENGFTIRGMAGRPDTHRGSRSQQILFVNQRPVQHRALSGAIFALYRDHLKARQFPVYVLMIEVDPARIDVNIHPSKSEVRFREQAEATRAVRHAIAPLIRDVRATPRWGAVRRSEGADLGRSEQWELRLGADRPGGVAPPVFPSVRDRWSGEGPVLGAAGASDSPGGIAEQAAAMREEIAAELGVSHEPSPVDCAPEAPPGVASVWQYALTYIFTPLKGDLLIVDQHTAHERVLFERTMAAILEGDVPSQRVLFPIVIEPSPAEAEALETHRGDIARVGYELEEIEGRISLVGVPAVGRDSRAGQIFQALLGELAETGEAKMGGIERVAAGFACKAAVKAGDTLNEQEMGQLVNELFATEKPFFCPHGRPTVVRVPLGEIERRFGRI